MISPISQSRCIQRATDACREGARSATAKITALAFAIIASLAGVALLPAEGAFVVGCISLTAFMIYCRGSSHMLHSRARDYAPHPGGVAMGGGGPGRGLSTQGETDSQPVHQHGSRAKVGGGHTPSAASHQGRYQYGPPVPVLPMNYAAAAAAGSSAPHVAVGRSHGKPTAQAVAAARAGIAGAGAGAGSTRVPVGRGSTAEALLAPAAGSAEDFSAARAGLDETAVAARARLAGAGAGAGSSAPHIPVGRGRGQGAETCQIQ